MAVCELILVVINCVLALGGALVLYVGLYFQQTGWVDVIEGYWSPIHGIVIALIAIGSVIIGLAVLGFVAALCRWRIGLCIYAALILFIFAIFVVAAVIAFAIRHRASDWERSVYPANSDEVSVKNTFDQAYCYAQGAYVCNEASISEALDMFVPTLPSSIGSLFENVTGGVNALCDGNLGSYVEIAEVCDGCNEARQFKTFSSVIDWANAKCPRTAESLMFCGGFLRTGDRSPLVGTAPYAICRVEFLNLVEKYTLWLGMGSLIVCAGALMVVTFACILRRRERHPQTHFAYRRF